MFYTATVDHSAGSRPSCSPGPTPAYTGGCGQHLVGVFAGLQSWGCDHQLTTPMSVGQYTGVG